MSNETLENNLNVFQSRNPTIADLIRSTTDTGHLQLEEAESGHPTLKVVQNGGGEQYLHSSVDPVGEAENLLKRYDTGEQQNWIVFGMALGYHLEELQNSLSPVDTVYVFEKDVAVLRKAMEARDLTDLLGDDRFGFLVNMNPFSIHEYFRPRLQDLLSFPLKMMYHPPSLQVFEAYYRELREGFIEMVETGKSTVQTKLVLPRRNVECQFQNLSHYLRSPGIKPFENQFEGVPGFLVGAGPSLEKNIQHLREAGQKGIIFAAGTALVRLLDSDIQPHFTGAVDYHEISGRYYEDIDRAEDIYLVADTRAAWEAIDRYSGPVCFYNHHLMSLIMDRYTPDFGSIKSGSSVAQMGFQFLRYCGCDPIVLVGQDLAYPYNISHVSGTSIYDQWTGEINRFQTFEMKEWEFVRRYRSSLRQVEDIHGQEIFTDTNMYNYLKNFERLCFEVDARCIDATEGGAQINGTEQASLNNLLDSYLELPPDLVPAKEDITPSREELELRTVRAWDQLKGIRSEAKRLTTHFHDMLEKLNEIQERLDRNQTTEQPARDVLDLREKTNAFERVKKMLQISLPAAEMVRQQDDLRIEAKELEGYEKQEAQVKRNVKYIHSLLSGLTFISELTENAIEDVQSLLTQFEE